MASHRSLSRLFTSCAAFLGVALFLSPATQAAEPPTFVYTNNNTSGSNTVSVFGVNSATGELALLNTYATGGNGTGGGYFASQRALVCGTLLYVSNDGSSTISGFSIAPATGALSPVPGSPFPSGGTASNGISLDCTPDGRFLVAAHDGSKTLVVFAIAADGALTLASTLPTGGTGANGIRITPDGALLAVALVGSDEVGMYRIHPDGTLTLVGLTPSPTSGSAAGIDIDSTSTFLYVGEANSDDTIVNVFRIESDGALALVQTTTAGNGANSNVVLRGKHLFVSNQFSTAVSAFAVNPDGTLTLVGTFTGFTPNSWPAGMALNGAETLLFTANYPNTVSSARVNSNGSLTVVGNYATGQNTGIESLAVFPANVVNTTTGLSASANPALVGSPVTFTATITAVNGTSAPVGTAELIQNGGSIGSAPLSPIDATQSQAQWTINFTAGAYSLQAIYAGATVGGTTFTGSQSAFLNQTVSKANTTTVVTGSPNPSAAYQAVTFTAQVTPQAGGSTPTGTVQFYDNGAAIGGPIAVNNGIATYSTSALGIGTHTISADYSGNANLNPSTGSMLQTVGKASTITLLNSSANPSVVGQSILLTTTVTGPEWVIPGQTGHWSVNEATGATTAADTSGSGNNATCTGTACPTFGGAGTFGTVATFDGVNDVLRANNTFSTTFTASVWMRTTQVGTGNVGDPATVGNGIIWSDVSGPRNDIIPMTLVNNRVAFGTGEFGAPYNTITSTVPVNTGAWVHVVVTRDSVSGAKQLFINGALDASGIGAKGALGGNAIVAFGGNLVDNRFFNGAIDDIQLFNRVLTPAEVQSLYSDGPSPAGPTGTVTFSADGTTLGTRQLVGGTATFAVTGTSLTLGDHELTATYAGDASYGGSAGGVTQTVNQASSRTTVTSSGTWRYGQPMSVNITVNPVSPGSGIPTGTVTLFDGSEPIATVTLKTSTASYVSTTFRAVGSHPFTATYNGDANYKPSTSAIHTRTVAKAPLTIRADNQTSVYGATLPEFTVTYSGFVNGETGDVLATPPTVTSTGTASSHVGSYTLTPGGAEADNYSFTYVAGTLTITPAPLTIAANNQTKVYGAPLPELTVSYNGLVNGDTAANLAIAPVVTTTATAASPVGTYPITVSGASSADYTLSYVPGTLTVTPAVLSVTANSASRVYGDPNPVFTASYSGFQNGETLATSGVTGAPGLTTVATAATDAGSYAIVAASGTLSAANYTFAFVNGTLTITPATLTVVANDATALLGSLPTFTASFSGFKNGQALATSDVTGAPSLTTAATASSPVGTYPVIAAAGTLASRNYTFTFVTGTLTITYNICLQYDTTKAHQGGSTIPIKLHICDANGVHVSSASLMVHATAIVLVSTSVSGTAQDAGNANPDADFRVVSDGGGVGYIFNLQTRGLGTGSYHLLFTVSGDATPHAAPFQIR